MWGEKMERSREPRKIMTNKTKEGEKMCLQGGQIEKHGRKSEGENILKIFPQFSWHRSLDQRSGDYGNG